MSPAARGLAVIVTSTPCYYAIKHALGIVSLPAQIAIACALLLGIDWAARKVFPTPPTPSNESDSQEENDSHAGKR